MKGIESITGLSSSNPENTSSIPLRSPIDSKDPNVNSVDPIIPPMECLAEREDSQPQPAQEEEGEFPEGGWQAWGVALGAWCAMLPCFGLLNTMGVLQAWLATHQLQHYTQAQVGWIFSAYTFFFYFFGVQVGPIFDAHGLKMLLIPGCVGLIACIFLFSVAKEYYQFFLTFGVLGGISASLVFTPSIASVGHWFLLRRGLATGLATTAGGFGGVIFPLIILNLAPKIGFGWAIRVIGFICVGSCIAAVSLLRTRLPPNKKAGASIDLKALRDRKFAMTELAIWLVEFAVFIPLEYITSYALSKGMRTTLAYELIAILNAGSVLGRGLPGYVADKWGRFNVMIITTLVCSLLTLCLWLSADANEAAIIGYAVLFGFWSGSAISLTPVCVAQVCRTEDYGKRHGTTYFLVSFGTLTGIPIAGEILQRQGGNDYQGLILFGGITYLAAVLAFVVARGFAAGWSPWIKF